ncbi:nucleoporin autopeptidase-domain-containing protein [Trametes meyenii]|nr:nucleoporin autopeptidase-domain-containing protein [Trametes meyenii]
MPNHCRRRTTLTARDDHDVLPIYDPRPPKMFGSSWANPQQNQQNQQQPSAFGQPSGFGTTGAFGSGGAFGQPQQPQQPQANPMFGNLSGPGASTSTTGTGFGAFGSGNTSNAGGGLFGQSKPATGFGAFGGGSTSAFGSTAGTTSAFGSGGGAFGNNNATPAAGTGTGIFGAQPSTSTSAFGGSSLFGANKPATGFGATPAPTDGGAPITTGTANPPFSAFNEKDNINPTLMLQYQSITAMPQYRSASFEELRLQDYQQGRKTAGAFGQSSFGAPAQPAQSSTGLFGQPAAPAATGTTFGGFGNASSATQPATTGFGTFGQPANQTNTTGGGLFGGTFGQQNQQQPQSQPQQSQAGGFSGFGLPQNQQNTTGGGLFGGGGVFGSNTQAKPAFGTGTNTFGSGGTFSQAQTNPQQPAGGLFGQTQQNNTGTSGFGTFGTNNGAAKPSLFGNTTTTATAPAATGFSGFGTQNQAQQQQNAQPSGGLFGGGGGLFGQTQPQQNNQQQPPAGGLFGNTQPAQQQQTGGLFSGGGGLFSNNQQPAQQGAQQQNQNSLSGLFGPKPATTATQPAGGGLFGGGFGTNTTLGQPPQNQPAAGGLFGSTLGQQPQTQQNTNMFGGGGLFGPKPAAPTLGMSTSTGQQQGGLGSSLFGNSTLGATMGASTLGQSQTPLTASIAQPIAAPLPIFSMLPPGPRAVTLDQQPKKKAGYFVDVPTRSPVPQLQLRYAPAGTKLRGFGSTSAPLGASSSTLGGSLLYSSGKPNALSLSKASTTKSLLGPDAFLTNGAPSPTLGSGGRQSVKKLTLDKRVEAADLFSKSNSGLSFSPALSLAAREKQAAAASASNSLVRLDSPSPAGRNESPKKTPNRFVAQSTSEILGSPARAAPAPSASPAKGPKDPSELQEGDYWVKPDLDTLKRMGHDELMSFSGLIVGRVGYGQITFLEPVDLTGLPRLLSLLGEIVRFDDKECSVYPDADDAEKPPPGSGLNVKARIELVRCWALDKATREPIKDAEHPAAQRHLKRLRNMKETRFEGFDLEEGKWTFTVDHF